MEAGCRETWRLTWPPTPPLASLLEKGKDDQRQVRRVRLRGGSQHTPTLFCFFFPRGRESYKNH